MTHSNAARPTNAIVSCWLTYCGVTLPSPKAAMLSFSKNEAEVVVPQLALRDLLSYRAEEVHNAAMFVRECLEVRWYNA